MEVLGVLPAFDQNSNTLEVIEDILEQLCVERLQSLLNRLHGLVAVTFRKKGPNFVGEAVDVILCFWMQKSYAGFGRHGGNYTQRVEVVVHWLTSIQRVNVQSQNRLML